jgi:SAM-dependent methyltransferase
MPMVLTMQILAIYGLSRSLVANTGSLFQGMGRPDISMRLQLWKLLFLAIFIYPLIRYSGIAGAAVAVVVSGIFVDIYVFYRVHKILNCPIRNLAKSIFPSFFTTIFVMSFLTIVKRLNNISTLGIWLFVCFVFLGSTLYALLTIRIARVGNWLRMQPEPYAAIQRWLRVFENHMKLRIMVFLNRFGGQRLIEGLKRVRAELEKFKFAWHLMWGKLLKNSINKKINSVKNCRYLEIGCGGNRIPGFETLDVRGGKNVDYILDTAKPLPFENNTFNLIYASHVLEHIPWYRTEEVLREWVRILKHGGQLEIWVPDGLKVCETLLKAESENPNIIGKDGWYKLNPRKDPCLWAAGRIFTYGDGMGTINSHNWHRAIFTPRYLKELFERAGLSDIRPLDRSEVRGHDHGWINLGFKGRKP